MTNHPVLTGAGRRSLLTLAWAIPVYWLHVFPAAGRELTRWRRLADRIPDPQLRGFAQSKLEDERASAEGAAAFAILAARHRRLCVARACLAFEVLYDYLDAVGEASPTLDDNRRLHNALVAAVDLVTDRSTPCFYGARWGDDGGYLAALVAACRTELARLPSARVVSTELHQLTIRAGEAQSRNHAQISGDCALAPWAKRAAAREADLTWFEFAAGAGSPLGMLALFAAASHPTTSEKDAGAIADAYFPWVAALHWLMESVVDHSDDQVTGNPSYVANYGSTTAATTRLVEIARRSASDLASLPCPRRHLLLLAGMVALNLVQADAEHGIARDVTPPVREAIGPTIAPFVMMLRLRARLQRLSRVRRPRPAEAA